MDSLENIKTNNDVASLRHYNRVRWDGTLKTLTDPNTKAVLVSRTFANKGQALRWLRSEGLDIFLF
jgi:hypothetical protein